MFGRLSSPVYWAVAAGLSALVAAGPVAAGPTEARAYYDKAKEAYAAEEYDRAAELLKKAYAEDEKLVYQYNRIRALQGADRHEEALEVLDTYESELRASDEFEDIAELKRKLQKKAGADREDGSDATTASGRESSGGDQRDDGSDGDNGADGDDGSDEATSEPSNIGLQALGWSLSGVGVASLGVGTLFGTGLLLPSDTREALENGTHDATDVQTLETHQTATTILLAAGGATLIAGGVLVYTQVFAPSGDSGSRRGLDLRAAPYLSREGGGAVLDIRF